MPGPAFTSFWCNARWLARHERQEQQHRQRRRRLRDGRQDHVSRPALELAPHDDLPEVVDGVPGEQRPFRLIIVCASTGISPSV